MHLKFHSQHGYLNSTKDKENFGQRRTVSRVNIIQCVLLYPFKYETDTLRVDMFSGFDTPWVLLLK